MRRLISLFVIAVLGAGLFGWTHDVALSSNNSAVSSHEVNAELTAIDASPTLQCYVTSLDPVSFSAGAGNGTMNAAGVAAWSNLRIEGMTIIDYVSKELHYTPTSTALTNATTAMQEQMSQAAESNSFTCAGTPAEAFAAMTPTMRSFEALSEADSLELVSKLNSTIPLTTASIAAYYNSHVSDYDTLCVSIALVAPSRVTAFEAAAKSGESVTALAKEFSVDPSASKGGAYGCFSPSNSSFSAVRSDVNGLALNTFASSPAYVTVSGSEYGLFVAVTKRSTTPYAEAETAVLSDLQSANATSANTIKENLLYAASVMVNPALGRWGLDSSGPAVFTKAVPATTNVTNASVFTAVNSTPYH